MNCRFCQASLGSVFCDLGFQPPSNSFLTEQQLQASESYYPLKVMVCHQCWLVQLAEYKKAAEIFRDDYVYFSSYSDSWLAHAKQYVDHISDKLNLNQDALVVEIASNDGYLLQYFKERSIPCLGIEPSSNTAEVAKSKGIDTVTEFFGNDLALSLAAEHKKADLIVANNVFAHVPDINDFVVGLKTLLKPQGVITIEFPHLLRLIEEKQFDTIYHEHYSYLSLYTATGILKQHGLTIYDVEELGTHGGSLRIYAAHESEGIEITKRYRELIDTELAAGINKASYYEGFQPQVNAIKNAVLNFLLEQKKQGKLVVGYGAAAKGNTLLNYAGVKKDLLACVMDRSPHKQGKYLPGSHIPVVSEESLSEMKPDCVVVLPWNLAAEVKAQFKKGRTCQVKLVTWIPEVKVL